MPNPDEIRTKHIATAEAEAKRFLSRIAALRVAINREPGVYPKERGAMKRASLDLTRALADLRRSPYA